MIVSTSYHRGHDVVDPAHGARHVAVAGGDLGAAAHPVRHRAHQHVPLVSCTHEIVISAADDPSVSQSVFTIMERGPTQAFSWLKVPTCRGLLRDFEIFGILLTAFVSTSNCDSSFEYLAKPVYL